MNKKFTKTQSLPYVRILVRVLRPIPVFEHLQPEVGKVYDAVKGFNNRKRGQESADFCYIELAGKKIVLRRGYREEPEYEEVQRC